MVIFYDKSSRSRKIFIAPGPKRINIAHLPQNCPQGSQHCNLPSNCPLNRIEGPLPHMMSKLAKTNMEPLHGISDVYVFVLLEAYSRASAESTLLGWSDHFCTALRYLWLCLFEIGRRGALLPLLAITHAVVYLVTRLSGPSNSKLDLKHWNTTGLIFQSASRDRLGCDEYFLWYAWAQSEMNLRISRECL